MSCSSAQRQRAQTEEDIHQVITQGVSLPPEVGHMSRVTSFGHYHINVRNLSVSPERAVTPEWQKKSERRSMSSDGMSQRSSQSSTDWGYTSYNNFTASSKGGNSSSNNSNNTR